MVKPASLKDADPLPVAWVKHQSAARPQQAGGLGDPPGRVPPPTRPAFGDHKVEAGAGKRDLGGVCLDEREDDPGLALALPRGAQLGGAP